MSEAEKELKVEQPKWIREAAYEVARMTDGSSQAQRWMFQEYISEIESIIAAHAPAPVAPAGIDELREAAQDALTVIAAIIISGRGELCDTICLALRSANDKLLAALKAAEPESAPSFWQTLGPSLGEMSNSQVQCDVAQKERFQAHILHYSCSTGGLTAEPCKHRVQLEQSINEHAAPQSAEGAGKEVMPSETTKGAGEVAELARELYNRFVPSGWDSRYAHEQISAMLKAWASSQTAALRQENERLASEINKWINHGLKLQAERDALRQEIQELKQPQPRKRKKAKRA
jgi:hypothetical protein